jgi:putative thioredoxin
MMTSDLIVNVTEADFEYLVLIYSQEIPVIVDFWAEWCAPCRLVGPILEKLTQEAQGGFRLAKVNVDENPNLAARYQIHSIPAVKVFRDHRIVAEFTGVRPEPQLRDFLRGIAPSPSDLALEKGLSMLQSHKPKEAEIAFREVVENSPNNPTALLGLSRSLLYQGKPQECLGILNNFPASREFNSAEILRPLAEALHNPPQSNFDPDNHLDASFLHILRLLQRENFEAAMDGLLDILRQDKRYRNGQAHRLILAILELMGEEDPTAREYRSELASVLF